MNRETFQHQLQIYQTEFEEEKAFISRFKSLLREELCYSRDSLHGHLTASSWILNHRRDAVLMLHHRKLDRWLQPGGHADGMEDLTAVARKEATEETGLQNLQLLSTRFFDLDIHRIPERRGIAAHDHYDVRYLFLANPEDEISQNEESHEVKWIALTDLEKFVGNEPSILRMREKGWQN